MKKIFFIAVFIAAALNTYAQSVPSLNISADPYAMSMGGVSLTLEQNAFTLGSNSSSMAFSESKFHLGGSYGLWQPDYMKNNNIGFSTYGVSKRAAFGIAGKMFGYQPYEVINSDGVQNGTFTPMELSVEGAFAYRISKCLSAGVNVRGISSKLAEEASAMTVAADVSVTYRNENFTIAAAVTNIGGSLDYGTSTKYSLPSMAKIGAGYAFIGYYSVFRINVEGDYLMNKSAIMAGIGGEYSFRDIIKLRAGYHVGSENAIPTYYSAGLGLQLGFFNLDAAYIFGGNNDPVLNGSFGLACGIRF